MCPQCGEPVPDKEATVCMVCGHSLKRRYTMRKDVAVVAALMVVAVVVAYFFLEPVFFGQTTVTSTGDVKFTVTLADGTALVEYGGTADGRTVTDLQIAILAEGGRSSRMFSMNDPQPGTVLGPVEINTSGKPVAVYYVVIYADGTEISNTIRV